MSKNQFSVASMSWVRQRSNRSRDQNRLHACASSGLPNTRRCVLAISVARRGDGGVSAGFRCYDRVDGTIPQALVATATCGVCSAARSAS
jgi:hypothetical protein